MGDKDICRWFIQGFYPPVSLSQLMLLLKYILIHAAHVECVELILRWTGLMPSKCHGWIWVDRSHIMQSAVVG
jgi:hypothetical protein